MLGVTQWALLYFENVVGGMTSLAYFSDKYSCQEAVGDMLLGVYPVAGAVGSAVSVYAGPIAGSVCQDQGSGVATIFTCLIFSPTPTPSPSTLPATDPAYCDNLNLILYAPADTTCSQASAVMSFVYVPPAGGAATGTSVCSSTLLLGLTTYYTYTTQSSGLWTSPVTQNVYNVIAPVVRTYGSDSTCNPANLEAVYASGPAGMGSVGPDGVTPVCDAAKSNIDAITGYFQLECGEYVTPSPSPSPSPSPCTGAVIANLYTAAGCASASAWVRTRACVCGFAGMCSFGVLMHDIGFLLLSRRAPSPSPRRVGL